MTGNSARLGSDLARVDAYQNTAADYDEIPELTEEDLARGTWAIGDHVVSEAEGRAAMGTALTSRDERIDLDLPGDVLAAFRVGGPDWRDRMVEALKKAAGL